MELISKPRAGQQKIPRLIRSWDAFLKIPELAAPLSDSSER
jgi:hypothetical protein